MAEGRAARLERLFHAALGLPTGERADFLSRSCGDDVELAREIEALLAHDARDGSPLDVPVPRALGLSGTRTTILIGKRLGPYLLERCIATGGMGAVYAASQERPRRAVAVKVLRLDAAGPELERRFRVEASLLARLQHPGIAHVYAADVAELDGVRVPYIAMELVPGARDVIAFARERGLGLDERVRLIASVADAVHHGHQRGVIHRDLKPGNVLVDGEGRPKLIDFGVARAVGPADEGSSVATAPGAILGTAQYMSPEQWIDPRDVDVRSDVYALGAMLYELLCGRPPHDLTATPFHRAASVVLERAPAPPSSVDPRLRGDLSTILAGALERDRERRYQSAGALAADLRRFLAREPIAARPPSPLRRVALFARRNRALTTALLLIALVLIGATAISASFYVDERRARRREARSSMLANVAAADLSLRAHDAAGARRRLERVPPDLRRFEWHHLRRKLDAAARVIRGPRARCEALAWRDGRLASAWHFGGEPSIVVWDESGEERARLDLEVVPTRLAWNADGSLLFGDVRGDLHRWEPGSADAATLVGGHGSWVTAIDVLPNGVAASAGIDGTLILWDVGAARERRRFDLGVPSRDLDARGYGASAEELRAVVAGADGVLRLVDLGGGEELRRFSGHAEEALAVAFGPGGELVASGSADGTIRLWRAEDGEALATLAGHGGPVQDVAFTPDGGALVSASEDRTVRVWDVASRSQGRVLPGHGALVKCLDVRSDATGAPVFATGAYDGTLRLWNAGADAAGLRIGGHVRYVRRAAFSPDGTRLATASADGSALLVDPRDWRRVARLGGSGEPLAALAFDARSELVATAGDGATIRLWDAATGAPRREVGVHDARVHALAFHPAAGLLASGATGGALLLTDVETDAVVARWRLAGGVQQVAFAPGGERLGAISSQGEIAVWDVASGAELWRDVRGLPLHDLAFDPRGGPLAVAAGGYDGAGGEVLLLDAADGRPLGTLDGHTDLVLSVAWAPDGRRLASTSADATARLWDPVAGEEVLALRGHGTWVWCAAFSPDGATLVTGAGDPEATGAGVEVRAWFGR